MDKAKHKENSMKTVKCPHCASNFIAETQQDYIDFNVHKKFCLEHKEERDYYNEEATLS